MTDPAELVSTIFVTATMAVIGGLVYWSLQGNEIAGLARTVSALAVPFVVLLIVLFFVLAIVSEL